MKPANQVWLRSIFLRLTAINWLVVHCISKNQSYSIKKQWRRNCCVFETMSKQRDGNCNYNLINDTLVVVVALLSLAEFIWFKCVVLRFPFCSSACDAIAQQSFLCGSWANKLSFNWMKHGNCDLITFSHFSDCREIFKEISFSIFMQKKFSSSHRRVYGVLVISPSLILKLVMNCFSPSKFVSTWNFTAFLSNQLKRALTSVVVDCEWKTNKQVGN